MLELLLSLINKYTLIRFVPPVTVILPTAPANVASTIGAQNAENGVPVAQTANYPNRT